LTSVSGITAAIANNIVAYRNENGAFGDRRTLLKVPKLGPKAYEQSAGFLRIRGGKNPLDNTAVHPESYGVVEGMAKDLNVPLTDMTQVAERLKKADLKKYATDKVGEPTLRDILAELEKPGRDPRAEFKYATFKEGVKDLRDLTPGMELEGVITNVANFGAFVDIGVHQDGLIHVSQLADQFVSDPQQIVKVGQVVKVRVLEINEGLKRISLSMKAGSTDMGVKEGRGGKSLPQNRSQPQLQGKRSPESSAPQSSETQSSETQSSAAPTVEDLKAKFGKRR